MGTHTRLFHCPLKLSTNTTSILLCVLFLLSLSFSSPRTVTHVPAAFISHLDWMNSLNWASCGCAGSCPSFRFLAVGSFRNANQITPLPAGFGPHALGRPPEQAPWAAPAILSSAPSPLSGPARLSPILRVVSITRCIRSLAFSCAPPARFPTSPFQFLRHSSGSAPQRNLLKMK